MRKYKIEFLRKTDGEIDPETFELTEANETLFATYATKQSLSSKAIAESNLSQKIDEQVFKFVMRKFNAIEIIKSSDFIKCQNEIYKIISLGRPLDDKQTKYEFLTIKSNG